MKSSKFKIAMIKGIIAILIFIPCVIYDAFVVMKLWDWFIVGTFNVQELTLPIAAGISLLFAYMCPNTIGERKYSEFIALIICKPTVALILGFIFHLFM